MEFIIPSGLEEITTTSKKKLVGLEHKGEFIVLNDVLIEFKKGVLEKIWLKNYTAAEAHCTLCANTGIIDTTNSAISCSGHRPGRKNYCICPNGQRMKKQKVTIE